MYRRAEGPARERAGALLLAFVLGSIGMLDYLPSVGIDLQPIGYIAALDVRRSWPRRRSGVSSSPTSRPQYAAGQILETMKSAVVVSDMHGRIRVVNRGAERLLGYKADGLRDAHLRDILERDEQPHHRPAPQQHGRARASDGLARRGRHARRRAGRVVVPAR